MLAAGHGNALETARKAEAAAQAQEQVRAEMRKEMSIMREKLRRGEISSMDDPDAKTARYKELDAKFDALVAKQPAVMLRDLEGEKMVLNMGPSHPSTHGVLRIILELDGEVITRAMPEVGYLHRGKEKTCESLGWRKFFVHTDRLDYLSALMNNWAVARTVEKAAGIEVSAGPSR